MAIGSENIKKGMLQDTFEQSSNDPIYWIDKIARDIKERQFYQFQKMDIMGNEPEGNDINGLMMNASAHAYANDKRRKKEEQRRKDISKLLRSVNKWLAKIDAMIRALEVKLEEKEVELAALIFLEDIIKSGTFDILEDDEKRKWLEEAGLDPQEFEDENGKIDTDKVKEALPNARIKKEDEIAKIQKDIEKLERNRELVVEQKNKLNGLTDTWWDYDEEQQNEIVDELVQLGVAIQDSEDVYNQVFDLTYSQDMRWKTLSKDIAIQKFKLQTLKLERDVEAGKVSPAEMDEALKEAMIDIKNSHEHAYKELKNLYPEYSNNTATISQETPMTSHHAVHSLG